MSNVFMKEPCEHCPYRRDVKPFLTPQRGEELAYHVRNPYNTFHCHKTLAHDDEDTFVAENSKLCAGFLSLQHNELGKTIYDEGGFIPSNKAYSDINEMADAYEVQ